MSKEYDYKTDYNKAWDEMIKTSKSWLESKCPLQEDEVMVHMDDKLKRAEYIRKQQIALINRREARIERLRAQVKELKAANKDALEYLQREGTPYVNAAIATLEEKS